MKMRMLILMTACLFMAGAASAQGSFKLGVKGGATLYKIDGKAFKDEFQWGYHLGGVAEMMWSKNWGIQPEVLFQQSNTQTGYAFDTLYKSLNPGTIKNAKLNYLSIPILLTWKPSPLISFQAGPNFSILMSQQKTLLQDGAEAFKNGNVSLLGGVQLNIMSFRVYGRYSVGLSNINNIDGSAEKWKSRGAQIGVALMF